MAGGVEKKTQLRCEICGSSFPQNHGLPWTMLQKGQYLEMSQLNANESSGEAGLMFEQ